MDLTNSTAIVTGGGSGLGAATAALLSRQGVSVVVFDLPMALDKAAIKDDLTYVPVDVTDPRQVQRAVDIAAAQPSPLRIVVNCAGIAPPQRIFSAKGVHDLDLFAKVIHVNLIGSFHVLALAAGKIAATPALIDGQRGVVINTASVAAYEGQIGQAAYASSKGGIVALTLPAARDLAQYGIRVNTIAPGILETPMLATVSADFREALTAQVPFPRRLGRPEEYADLVLFLIRHDYLNGETFRLDGALRMPAR